MRITKEALDRPADRSGVFQATKDPSASRIVVRDGLPNACRSVWTAVVGELTRISSRIRQSGAPKPDNPTPQARRDPNIVTVTHEVSIHIKHGIIGLPKGKKLALVARRGETVQVRDINGANYDIPISATDLH